MVKKKSTKKQPADFYSEGTDFSDDPEDSFYATSEDGEETSSRNKGNKKKIMGFYTWEFLVVIGEIILIGYLVTVLLGLLPLL